MSRFQSSVESGFLLLGLSVVVVSVILALYSTSISDTGLLGIALSTGVVGGVLVVLGTAPRGESLEALYFYTRMIVSGSTVVLEDLDLLDAKLCAIDKGSHIALVYSKIACTDTVDPGVGFASGAPYYAIPVSVPVEVPAAIGESNDAIEEALNAVLVEELGLCRSVRVESEGGLLRIHVIGVSPLLAGYTGYPVNPAVLIPLAVLARITGSRIVELVEKQDSPRSTVLTVRVSGGLELKGEG